MTSEAERLKAGLEKAESVLSGAQELLSKLGGEKLRWDTQCQALDEELTPGAPPFLMAIFQSRI
jgi:hypothetical protein